MSRRHPVLEGCLNLRDLGGYPTTGGRVIRWGCLYRSAELSRLTDADLDTVGRLGIRVVVDLRNEHERAARPNRLPAGVELVERTSPSTEIGLASQSVEEMIVAGTLPQRDDELFGRMYIGLLERLAPEIKVILEAAATAADRPVLFHCAAGKDRTGLVAAVLLGVLGVPDPMIIEDYELSTPHYADRRLAALATVLAERGLAPDDVRHLLEARTPVLRRALTHLHDQWAGYDRYAIDVARVAPDLPGQLQAVLTEPG